jgi:hypothetical protein
MTAPTGQATSGKADDAIVDAVLATMTIDGFGLRCWARARLVEHGRMFLQEAVDGLQDAAVSTGLVDLLGQDAVQSIMAEAFGPRRRIMLQAQVGWRRAPRFLALELSRRFSGTPLGEIRLRDDVNRGFRLTFTTNSLMDGLWLQLAANISGGASFRSCARCGELFETGPGTGRRADSRFCKDAHRIEFNSRNRSKGPRISLDN